MKTSKKAVNPTRQDAVALLRADHKVVSGLFKEYEKTRAASRKKQLVAKICLELGAHPQIEEEIFYPAVKAALKDHELVPEAIVEHATLKALIAQRVMDRTRMAPDGGRLVAARLKKAQRRPTPPALRHRDSRGELRGLMR